MSFTAPTKPLGVVFTGRGGEKWGHKKAALPFGSAAWVKNRGGLFVDFVDFSGLLGVLLVDVGLKLGDLI